MHNRSMIPPAAMIVAMMFAGAVVNAQQVEFNYNGRVAVQGLPFDGDGLFKFSIVSDSDVTYWANDSATLDGSEPATSVPVTVAQGFFSVNIGDTALPNMAPLNASIFNSTERVFLRVWFSDQAHPFERLRPDRQIVNPALLGWRSGDEDFTIYVNATTGNDADSGLTTDTAKQTIQAAWNMIPPLVEQNITIHLAEGQYREQVLLTGKVLINDAKIHIEGVAAPQPVVEMRGDLETNPNTPMRDYGFHAISQDRIIIRNIRFQYYAIAAIFLQKDSEAEIRNCKFNYNKHGIHSERSSFVAADCDIDDGVSGGDIAVGLYLERFSSAVVENCTIHNQTHGGVAQAMSLFENVSGSTSGNNRNGFQISQNSNITFRLPMSTISNNQIGIVGGQNASITYAKTHAQLINNDQDFDLRSGSVTYDP